MQIESPDFRHESRIPGEFAFAVPDPITHIRLSENRNPGLHWREEPRGTRSLVLLCVDPDVPTRPDDVNQEGRVCQKDQGSDTAKIARKVTEYDPDPTWKASPD